MRQSDLEAEMKELGRHRYWKKVQRTTEGGMESQHTLGKRLLTESVDLLAEQIRQWKKQVEKQPVGNRNGCYPYIDMLDRLSLRPLLPGQSSTQSRCTNV